MRIPFKQNTLSGCGSYCLANLFDDDRFLTGVGELKQGQCVVHLNRQLDSYHPDVYLETVFATFSGFQIQQPRLVDPMVFDMLWDEIGDEAIEEHAVPRLITVLGPARNHCILVIVNLKDRNVYIYDSLQPERQIMTPMELITKYHIITVDYFSLWSSEVVEHTMFIYKDRFPHLFAPGE